MDPSLQFIDLELVDMQADRQTITAKIFEQMTNLGFLALYNIPDYDEAELLKHQKWLFE